MQQRDWGFAVDFHFPVSFTRDAFAPDNGVLADLMAPAADEPPSRAVVFIDTAVLAARPGLVRDIHAWFAAHADRRIALAAAPEPISGGEAAKQGLAVVERVARVGVDLGLCRHSYVLIIGGGAVIDAVGLGARCSTAACARSACPAPRSANAMPASASRTRSTSSA